MPVRLSLWSIFGLSHRMAIVSSTGPSPQPKATHSPLAPQAEKPRVPLIHDVHGAQERLVGTLKKLPYD